MNWPAGALVLPLLLTVLLGSSTGGAHHAVAHDMLVTATPRVWLDPNAADTARVHLALRNRSRHDHTLIAVESPVAAQAQIAPATPDAAGESPGAKSAQGIPIPARGTLQLTPGGPHILLTGLTTVLRPGDAVPVTLRFQDQSVLKLTAEVTGP